MKNTFYFDNIKKGFWLGLGFSISNNITTKIFQSIIKNNDIVFNNSDCKDVLKHYDNCIKYNDINCKDILKDFEKCRKLTYF